MSEVSVIGLGTMGTALARAFVRGGHHVTIWNRTSEKAAPLESSRMEIAPDLASAVDASATIVVCVDSYATARALLEAPEVEALLKGRIIVQLSNGTLEDALAAEAWVRSRGGQYLDATLVGGPEQVGKSGSTLRIAGAEAAFRRAESLLSSLAGDVTFTGERIGAAVPHPPAQS